jgi:ATP-binding cassette subfamily B protein
VSDADTDTRLSDADAETRFSIKGALRFGPTLRLVWNVSPGWTIANVVLSVVQGLLPLLGILLLYQIINGVTNAVKKPLDAAAQAAAFRNVAYWIVLAAGVGLVTAVARSVAMLVTEAQTQVVTDHVSDLVHSKSVEVDLQYYEDSKYYDLLQRAQQEAPYRPMSIIQDLMQVGQGLVTVGAMVALLLRLSWVVGLIVLAAALPSAIVRLIFSGKLYRWQRSATPADRKSSYLHWLLTNSSHAKEIRLFDLGDYFRDWFRVLRKTLRRERLGITSKRSLADLASGAVATLAVFGTFAYIAKKTIAGAMKVAGMVAYYQAFQTSLSALQQVLTGFAALYEDNLFMTYFHEFLALERTIEEPAHPKPMPRPITEGVVFDDVCFQYPETERTAIDRVSLCVKPGEVVALVGTNGSGKTTLVKLLCRLYSPQSGSITIDGTDLRELSINELRREISVIFQDYAQYQLSVRQNIWVGNIAQPSDDAAVIEAARQAGADEVINGLANGYDTPLGKWFADGEELSIGEWQKVALARAFYRDAGILVLDEPTSALDPVAELTVFERIREMARNRAVILISHRFSTVYRADRIYILDKGSVAESGTHAELMELDGVYRRMYEVQARAYQTKAT